MKLCFKILCISFILLTSCTTHKQEIASDSLKLMSFNIRYASAKDGTNSWQSRKNHVAAIIDNFSPDLFGIQEAEFKQLKDLKSLLPQFNYTGVARDDGKQAGEFSPIFYNPKRFQLLQQDTFWFSDTPTTIGSMSWGNFIPRICSWGRFRDLKNNKTFYIYNMHWDHASQGAREKSAQLLIAKIQRQTYKNDPVIIMGDFNAGKGNLAYDSLLQATDIQLVDSFSELNKEPQGTFHGFSGKALLPRIDAILVSKQAKIISSSIIILHQQQKYPSDHFPVTTIIKF